MNTCHRLLIGSISGIVATGPMTATMILLYRRLPRSEQYPLPPREITMKIAREIRMEDELSPSARSAATILSHFAYGAAGGALYTGAGDPRCCPLTKGLLFGLFVWLASYLGWLPAAGVLTPATEHPTRRNLLMIVVHLVWGAGLGGFAALLVEESEAQQPKSKPFSEINASHHDLAS